MHYIMLFASITLTEQSIALPPLLRVWAQGIMTLRSMKNAYEKPRYFISILLKLEQMTNR